MSSPNTLHISPDQSACSPGTGDVLIRSTRVLPPHGPGPGSVQITVQKLRDPSHLQPPLTGQHQRQQRPRQKSDISPPVRAAADSQPDDDLLTSRFTAGGRGVILDALKQRSQSAPHRREVRVQLLDPPDAAAPSSQDAAGFLAEVGPPSGHLGDTASAAAAAAATAAAVAAAAPLIKAQSDMEARMSQLADGVQKLLQADREGGDRGWSLSQETLQRQSQLLESALRVITGHVHTTSDLTVTGQPAHLQVTHLDAAAGGLSSQQLSFPATRVATAAVETVSVAMETCRRDRWPEQTRDRRCLQRAPSVDQQSSANHSQDAARRANEVLREMGRLKTEMKMLLKQPGDPLKTTRPAPDHLQTQRTQSHQNQSQQDQSQSHQNQSQQDQSQSHLNRPRSHQNPSRYHQNQSQPDQSHQNQSQAQQDQFQSHQNQTQSHQNQSRSHQNQSQQDQSQSHQNQSQQDQSQSHQNQSQQDQSQSHQNWPRSHQNQSQQDQSHQNQTQSHQNRPRSHQNQTQSHQNRPRSHQNQSQQDQSHQNQSQCNQSHQDRSQFQQDQSQSHQNQSHQDQSHQNQSHQDQSRQDQFRQDQSHQNQSQSYHSQFHRAQPQHSQQSQLSQSVLLQKRPVVPSMLEEAGQVLRQVRRQKKLLEENLEALLRAKTGEALAASRDCSEEGRIKRTVDAWIGAVTRDVQAEMISEDAIHRRAANSVMTSQQGANRSSAHTGRGRPVKAAPGRGSRGWTDGWRAVEGAEPDRVTGGLMDGEQVEVDRESYLSRLYGRAPYEGLRRTLKKSPYLRFSSPASPLSRKPRPRLVESVRGVKLKSCKTQTSLAPPLSLSPGQSRHHYVFRSYQRTPGDPTDLTVTPAVNHSVAIGIPLGRPRMDSSSRHWLPQEVTSPPTAPPTAGVVVVDDRAPERQKQQLDEEEAPPPPSLTVDIIERKSEEDEEQEEENIFPGTDFLSVADVVQEEVSVEGEEAVELDGGPSPPPVLYQGPAFPPQAPSALPAQDWALVPGIEQQQDALEDRLVEWVEQQLMSRMISHMYRPSPPDPAHSHYTDQSELEVRSITSDIVEAAGGGGLQLFVDSIIPVNSELIRQLVNEVLTETVALMLGQRDPLGTRPGPGLGPGPAADQQDDLVPLVPTPVPTPPPGPALPSRETTPVATPLPSEPASPLNEESPQPITAPEPTATPTPSPEPAPSAGPPSAVHQTLLTWGDVELPLDEERPEQHRDTHQQQMLMSVAQEEPPLSPPPPPSLPPAPSPPPPAEPGPASPSSSSEASSSSSSAANTGAEAALKHISEGELLISVNQLAAMAEEEAACSFSSSLQELQDMDFDPPSEGQFKGRDLLLTLLNKMEQGVTYRGERPQPEGSWGRKEDQEEGEAEVSMGEVRDDQKALRTAGRAQRGRTPSPGQISQAADVSDVSFETTNQGSVPAGNLTLEPISTLTSDLHTNLSLSPLPQLEDTHTAGQVVVVGGDGHTAGQEEEEEGGARRMDILLPSIRAEEEVAEEVCAADTDSSTNDVF